MDILGVLAALVIFSSVTAQDSKSLYNDNRLNVTRGFLSSITSFFVKPQNWNCQCGRPNRVNALRLVNGDNAQTHEFPWLVAVIVNGSSVYSGALINDRYVLTAASFLNRLAPQDVKVTFGADDRCIADSTSVNASVSRIILNPNYNPKKNGSDLALLKLSNPITFNQRVNPICLPKPNARYLGQVVTLVSWREGPDIQNATSDSASDDIVNTTTTTTSTTEPTRSMRATQNGCMPKKLGLPVIGEGTCPNIQSIPADTGCAGIARATNVACQYDMGSPVQYRDHYGTYQLVGILSAQNNCSLNMPTLYTRVAEYTQWISRQTQDASYCFNKLGIFRDT